MRLTGGRPDSRREWASQGQSAVETQLPHQGGRLKGLAFHISPGGEGWSPGAASRACSCPIQAALAPGRLAGGAHLEQSRSADGEFCEDMLSAIWYFKYAARLLSPFLPSSCLGVSQGEKRRRGFGSSVPPLPITDVIASSFLSAMLALYV